jgi:hypothetical protein
MLKVDLSESSWRTAPEVGTKMRGKSIFGLIVLSKNSHLDATGFNYLVEPDRTGGRHSQDTWVTASPRLVLRHSTGVASISKYRDIHLCADE